MRIVGLGTDVIECQRIGKMIHRHGEYFIDRIYTPHEIKYCNSHRSSLERFAGRWAAKEAVLKALGTGWRRGLRWIDIEILNQTGGEPMVRLNGEARAHAARIRISEIRVSVSHCEAFASAVALALGGEDAPLGGPSDVA